LNELEKMESHAEVLMRHIEINGKKIRQHKLKDNIWDMRRLEATLRIIHELRDLASLINARAKIQSDSDVDYIFYRMFGLIWRLLKGTGRVR